MKTPPSTTSIAVLYAATLLFHGSTTTAFVPKNSNTNAGVPSFPLRQRSQWMAASRAASMSGETGNRNSRRRCRCRRCRYNNCCGRLSAEANDDVNQDQNQNIQMITSEEVRIRNLEQLHKLRTRDRQSLKIAPGDLKIVYEDEHIVCVHKPAGVLCVPSEEGIPTLAQTVFETVPNQQTSLDRMVVHRLGMDTSGLVLFAKTMDSLREMNTLFRTRKIERRYEALVCGHVATDHGTIDLPLMRDYDKPPFMRVSTDVHQTVLLGLDASVVGKKLLEAPKASRTIYEVVARETFLDTDLPVTRVLLTSVTGRTHQLNVHMAAIGHPIVGDKVYGWKGDAVPNGGLELSSPSQLQETTNHSAPGATSTELQEAIGKVATNMCTHAKSLSFHHPMLSPDDDPMYFECETPF